MYSEKDIYRIFRQEQSKYLDRPYKLPKDWDTFFSKMSLDRKEPLKTITKFFNTKWTNIDPHVYFQCGFKAFDRNFSYHCFFNRRIIDLYINEDRAIKRDTDNVEEDLIKSVEFIDNLVPNGQTSKLFRYVNSFDGKRPRAITDYLANKIGKFFLVYLIKEDYIRLGSEQKSQLVYIDRQYGRYLKILNAYFQKTGNNLLERIL